MNATGPGQWDRQFDFGRRWGSRGIATAVSTCQNAKNVMTESHCKAKQLSHLVLPDLSYHI